MKKQLLLLPIVGLLLTGCGNKNSFKLDKKGETYNIADFSAYLSAAMDEFKAKDAFLGTTDPEKLTKDYANTYHATTFSKTTKEYRDGRSLSSSEYWTMDSVNSYDVDSNLYNSKYTEVEKEEGLYITKTNTWNHDTLYYTTAESENKNLNVITGEVSNSFSSAKTFAAQNLSCFWTLNDLQHFIDNEAYEFFSYGTAVDAITLYYNTVGARKIFTIQYDYNPLGFYSLDYSTVTAEVLRSEHQYIFEGDKLEYKENFEVKNVRGYDITEGVKVTLNGHDTIHSIYEFTSVTLELPTLA